MKPNEQSILEADKIILEADKALNTLVMIDTDIALDALNAVDFAAREQENYLLYLAKQHTDLRSSTPSERTAAIALMLDSTFSRDEKMQ